MSQPKQQPNDMEVDDEDVVETNAEVMNVDVVQQPPAEAGTCTMNIAGSSGAGPVINENAGTSNAARVMASSGTIGSVSISLHPLVIMNVSEHWTRLRAQEGSDQLGKFFLLKIVYKHLHKSHLK